MDFFKQLKHQLEYQIDNIVKLTPDISLILALSTILLSFFVTLDFINPYSLMLSWDAIKYRHQYYRIFTSMIYIGKVSVQWIFFLYTNIKYVVILEKRFSGKQNQFIFMLLFVSSMLLVASVFLPIYYPSFLFYEALTYIWTRFNPETLIVLFNIIPIQAKYLPVFNVVIKLVQQENIILSLVAIAIGHVYWMLYSWYSKSLNPQQQNQQEAPQQNVNQNAFAGRPIRF